MVKGSVSIIKDVQYDRHLPFFVLGWKIQKNTQTFYLSFISLTRNRYQYDPKYWDRNPDSKI